MLCEGIGRCLGGKKALKFAYILLYSCERELVPPCTSTYVFHVPFALYHQSKKKREAVLALTAGSLCVIAYIQEIGREKEIHTQFSYYVFTKSAGTFFCLLFLSLYVIHVYVYMLKCEFDVK